MTWGFAVLYDLKWSLLFLLAHGLLGVSLSYQLREKYPLWLCALSGLGLTTLSLILGSLLLHWFEISPLRDLSFFMYRIIR